MTRSRKRPYYHISKAWDKQKCKAYRHHVKQVCHEVEIDFDPDRDWELAFKDEKEFGSFDAWKADFKAAAVSAKLSGWGLLVSDKLYSGRLLNVLVDEHQYGAIWGGVPLISCDVFEHAYYHKDGPGRAKYIDNFFSTIHWERVNARYKKYVLVK